MAFGGEGRDVQRVVAIPYGTELRTMVIIQRLTKDLVYHQSLPTMLEDEDILEAVLEHT